MNEESMKLVMRVLSWCIGWNLLEEASALKELISTYELQKLELADKRSSE